MVPYDSSSTTVSPDFNPTTLGARDYSGHRSNGLRGIISTEAGLSRRTGPDGRNAPAQPHTRPAPGPASVDHATVGGTTPSRDLSPTSRKGGVSGVIDLTGGNR